jgi:hypothetical protein
LDYIETFCGSTKPHSSNCQIFPWTFEWRQRQTTTDNGIKAAWIGVDSSMQARLNMGSATPMKDSYWYVLGAFSLVGLAAWIGAVVGKRRGEKLLREGRLNEPKSMWTKDLFETRAGRMIATFVLPPLLIFSGVLDIIRRQARWEHFDYHGFDAVCIGVSEVGIGIVLLSSYGLPKRGDGGAGLRTLAIWIGTICLVAGLSIALFRNIK